MKEKSIDHRECTIDNHIGKYSLGKMQVTSVEVADIDDHVTDLMRKSSLSVSFIEKVVDVLNAAFNWAIMRGELQYNPVAPIKPTLVKRLQKMKQKTAEEADVDVLSVEEQDIFEQVAVEIWEKTGKTEIEKVNMMQGM